MSCNGNCTCKEKNDNRTEWVETDYGQQLRFAVPEEGMNVEDDFDPTEEIEQEILEMIDYKLSLHLMHGFSVPQICESIKEDTINIFNKYRK